MTKAKLLCLVLVLLMLFPLTVGAEEEPYAIWETPEGFEMISYSRSWDEEDLQKLYAELKKNIHGDEIYYLTAIKLIGSPHEAAQGQYFFKDSVEHSISASFSPLLPEVFQVIVMGGEIVLYNADSRNSVEDMARTLAHEYGHHFTFFHFLARQPTWDYTSVRGVDDHPRVGLWETEEKAYITNWRWDIREIAAEDYVQLMGSSTFKETRDILDITGMLDLYIDKGNLTYSAIWAQHLYPPRSGNTYPQANFFIPLATEVPGLKEYYMSFVQPDYTYSPPDIPRPILSYTRQQADRYVFTWQPVTDDPDVVYTLLSYNEEINAMAAVKTVRGNENLRAVVGTARRDGKSWSDKLIGNDQHFRLIVTMPCGHMLSSPTITIRSTLGDQYAPPGEHPGADENNTAPQIKLETWEQPDHITFQVQWLDMEVETTPSLYPLAIAVTDSPEQPELWQWQWAEEINSTVTVEQPGTWYVHCFANVVGEPLFKTFGPYEIAEEPSPLQHFLDWLNSLFN